MRVVLGHMLVIEGSLALTGQKMQRGGRISTGIALCEEKRVETIETSGGEDAAPATITTTLYDLLAALQDVVHPGEGALVVATVLSMLRAGRLTWRCGTAALESSQSGHRPDTGAGRYGLRDPSVVGLATS